MKKIIVAGAGHGGLIAAAKLAKNGYDVNVYEKKQRGELGHDWEDRFSFELLKKLCELDELPQESLSPRGDCVFVSPSYAYDVKIKFENGSTQYVMERKAVIDILLDYAERCGVKFHFGVNITAPVYVGDIVTGIKTENDVISGDMVIDSAGIFSPVRENLPEYFGIENKPKRGDVFFAYRAYFNRVGEYATPAEPFEVFLCHEGEQGLSWCCTNPDSVDILIGRIDPLTEQELQNHINNFRASRPWCGSEIVRGGQFGVIPVRRPLSLMVANGYAAVGDSAFMTTPMNGMGIDLSLQAGDLLAKCITEGNGDTRAVNLWKYNIMFHTLYGAETSKNEGLKNTLLNLGKDGVDFLFKNRIVMSGDLSGAGADMRPQVLLGKFVRGLAKPKYFFTVLSGISKGSKMQKTYNKMPLLFDRVLINGWDYKIKECVVPVVRRKDRQLPKPL